MDTVIWDPVGTQAEQNNYFPKVEYNIPMNVSLTKTSF